jgi:hypothetical protein
VDPLSVGSMAKKEQLSDKKLLQNKGAALQDMKSLDYK